MAAQRTWRESGGWRTEERPGRHAGGENEEGEGCVALNHSPAESKPPRIHQNLPREPKILSENYATYFRSGFADGDSFFVLEHVQQKFKREKKYREVEKGEPWGVRAMPALGGAQISRSPCPHVSPIRQRCPPSRLPRAAPLTAPGAGRIADLMTFCNCRRSLADKRTTVFIIPRGRRLALASSNKYGHSRPGLEQTALVGKGQRQHGAAV